MTFLEFTPVHPRFDDDDTAVNQVPGEFYDCFPEPHFRPYITDGTEEAQDHIELFVQMQRRHVRLYQWNIPEFSSSFCEHFTMEIDPSTLE